jgi:UDP-N-acetylglucosamine/UDP-N-acetyl-alpha-D-glucosaminouronate 4-epimerase
MSTYVVTGGAGFIGSHIAEALLQQNHKVRIVDNFSTGKPANIASFQKDVEVLTLDIASGAGLAEAFRGADYVIHEAAIPSVPKSMLDPVTSNRANVDGSLNVLVAARDAGVKRLVYASSSSLYGDSPALPKHEGMSPNPLSPYGAQKLFAEIYCQVFWKAYNFETVALRYFNVFGPRQDPTSQYSGVLAKFIPAVLQNRQPTIYGDGTQSRDFTYVANVVDANLLACTAPGIAGEAFNVACGDRITVNSMLAQVNKIEGKNVAAIFAPVRTGDILHSQADVTKARTMMGFQAKTSFEEGLRRTIAWYRDNPGD